MRYLSAPKRSYQVCQGIWNPAEQNHSWVVAGDHSAPGDARAQFKELEELGAKPLVILQVDTRIIEKLPFVAEAA